MDVDVGTRPQTGYRPILECIATMPQPVIGAFGGSAAGIGMAAFFDRRKGRFEGR